MTIPIYIGSDPVVKVYVGASEAEAIYVGADKVWPLGGSYTAKAVHFDGSASLYSASLTDVVDTPYLTFGYWVKFHSLTNFMEYINPDVTNYNTTYQDQGSGGSIMSLTADAPNYYGVGFSNNVSMLTSDVTAVGSNILHFASTSFKPDGSPLFISVGMVVPYAIGTTIPPGTTIVAFDETTVTMSNNVVGTQIDSGSVVELTHSPISVDNWIWIGCMADTNHGANAKICKLFFGNSDVTALLADSSSPSFNIHFTDFAFSDITPDTLLDGDVSDFWWAPGQFLDLSVESNRRKFITADGKPVNLGADGSLPTGTAPSIFFSGDHTAFSTNQGTGGAFTLTGTLTDASSSPSD